MRPTTLIFLTIFLSFAACKHKEKNPCEDIYCDPPPSVLRPIIKFSLRDANNRDYFFSQPPSYAYSQLTVNVPDSAGPVQMYIDSFSTTHSFVIPAPSPGSKKTLYFKITGQQPDTLRFDDEFYNASCCSVVARLTNIQLNGKSYLDKYEGLGGNILVIHVSH